MITNCSVLDSLYVMLYIPCKILTEISLRELGENLNDFLAGQDSQDLSEILLRSQ